MVRLAWRDQEQGQPYLFISRISGPPRPYITPYPFTLPSLSPDLVDGKTLVRLLVMANLFWRNIANDQRASAAFRAFAYEMTR